MATIAGTSAFGNPDLMRLNLFKAVRLYMETLLFPTWKIMVGNVGTTKQLYERIATVNGLPMPVITPEYGPIQVADIGEVNAANYQPQKRALAFRMSDESFINDQYGVVRSYGTELKTKFDLAREYAAAVYLNGAIDATQIALPNGETLSSATHALEVGTNANTFTGIQQALSISALESLTAILAKTLAYKGYEDARWGPFRLEVSPVNGHLADRLISSDKYPQTNDNDPNSIKNNRNGQMKVTDYVCLPTAANDDWWSLCAIDNNKHSRYCVERYPFKLTELVYDGGNDSWKVTAKESYIFVCFDYRGQAFSTAA